MEDYKGFQGSSMMATGDCEDSVQAKSTQIGEYSIVHDNGNRRFGPPQDWVGESPQRGCEIFIGKIPKDCLENELIPVFGAVGPIYEFRLMVDFNGVNRGYGFCVYQDRMHSNEAVERLNNFEIRPGRRIAVCFSVDNCRLFVGGIPKNKTKEDILSEMQKVTSGVVDVIAYSSIANKHKNRGFAFVEYESHKAAAFARRKLIPGRIPLWGQQIAVDWAEPEREIHEDVMSTVKVLYARNLMLSTTEETLKEKFLSFSGGPYNCIERVKKMKDYAFIHFTERIYAEKAKSALNNTEVDGCIIEVTWAKPTDKSHFKQTKSQSTNNEFSNGDLHGSTQIYYDPQTGLSYIGPTLANWSNSTTMLGDGGTRHRTARRNAAGSRNMGISKEKRESIEYLEELANTYNWGTPTYSTSVSEFDRNGEKTQLYSAQILLPNLNVKQITQFLHSTSEEAKSAAADLFIRSVMQPPRPLNDIDVQLQLAALQTQNHIQLSAIIGTHNQEQTMHLNGALPYYYLQHGLVNSPIFHSHLQPPHSAQLNLAALSSLYQNSIADVSSILSSPSQDVKSWGNLSSVSGGLNILPCLASTNDLPTNMDTGNGVIYKPHSHNVFITNQQ